MQEAFLIEHSFPWHLVERIGVHSQPIAPRITEARGNLALAALPRCERTSQTARRKTKLTQHMITRLAFFDKDRVCDLHGGGLGEPPVAQEGLTTICCRAAKMRLTKPMAEELANRVSAGAASWALQDEVLNETMFRSPDHVRAVIVDWVTDHNTQRRMQAPRGGRLLHPRRMA
jgi:hypothetical protein